MDERRAPMSTTIEHSTYWTAQTATLVRGFERFARRLQPVLAAHYDEALAARVVAASRREFARLIPELPDIGGRANFFTPVILVNGWLIALRRTMKAEGKTAADTIRVAAEISDDFFRAVPGFALRLGGRIAFTGLARRAFEKQAARSQERQHPEDFVYTARAEDNGELVLEFTECAVNKLYDAQGVEELKPYCNFFDVTYSRLMDMGVDAQRTIGLGCETCQLRYKHGRETAIPARLQHLLPRT